MSELLVEPKKIVIPGEQLATGMEYLPSFGTYRKDETIYANMLGLVSVDGKVIKLIPVSGQYIPRKGDTVIGRVFDILISGWRIDINCGNSAVLSLQEATSEFVERGADLTKYFDIDDYVVCQITNITSQKLIDVSMNGPGLRKLTKGRIISVTPYKVPRIIGKQGSMVSMIKDATDSKIVVGQNGLVWVYNDNPEMEFKAVEAIRMVDKNSHISGLTEKVQELLK